MPKEPNMKIVAIIGGSHGPDGSSGLLVAPRNKDEWPFEYEYYQAQGEL